MEKNSLCFPRCSSFRCGQRALTSRQRRLYCRWADDDCVGITCNYAICIRGRMLSNGICGLSIKKKTYEEVGLEPIDQEVKTIKLRGRLFRRFREDEII